MPPEPLLELRGLEKHYPVGGGWLGGPKGTVKAVDGVDLSVAPGETVGLVGESGCGKSTLGRCVLRLEEPSAGEILFEGRAIAREHGAAMRRLRRDIQIIFQDPYASLNPRKTVGAIIGDAFRTHGLYTTEERQRRIRELIGLVGLLPEHIHRYPHEFSGGQRQRICVARALALNPKLVVADEPVSALDVSIQAQILNLLVSLQRRLGLTYLFISHDLGVVRHIADRVGVMYLGRLVELAPTRDLYRRPFHPYTRALLSAVPRPGARRRRGRSVLAGEVPSPMAPPPGCVFHPRCPERQDVCQRVRPTLQALAPDRLVACHFPINQEETDDSQAMPAPEIRE